MNKDPPARERTYIYQAPASQDVGVFVFILPRYFLFLPSVFLLFWDDLSWIWGDNFLQDIRNKKSNLNFYLTKNNSN